MSVQVGACPQCGAPIYSPANWNSVTPPPAQHTCACAAPYRTIVMRPDTRWGETATGNRRNAPVPPLRREVIE